MKKSGTFLLFLLTLLLSNSFFIHVSNCTSCPHPNSKYELTIPDGYDSQLPDYDFSNPDGAFPAQVFITFVIGEVVEVNDEKAELTIEMTLSIWWKDSRLITDNCSGIVDDALKDKIWKPPLYVGYSRDTRITPILGGELESLLVSDGLLQWRVGIASRISCRIFFEDFPFDTQFCSFWISAPTMDNSLLQISSSYSLYGIPQKSLDYHVAYAEARNLYDVYNISRTGFEIVLHRKMYPFMMNIILPTYGITFIVMGSFLVPPSIVPGK